VEIISGGEERGEVYEEGSSVKSRGEEEREGEERGEG
jgi:hypothetical protein